MADVLYVGLQDDDRIVTFGIDAGAAKLVPRAETPTAPANISCRPTTRARTRPCTRSEATVR